MEKFQVTLSQAAALIRTCGDTNTILLRGAPGIGKSSILKMLAEHLPGHIPAYIDVATLDLGDIAMPVVDRENMVTEYAPNARFGLRLGTDKPLLIMLDELGKASPPVLNMLLPLPQERRLGDRMLPDGSIVFATTNLDTDNVGDRIPAHAYNRMTVVDVANPTSKEWLAWAADNDIAAEVCNFATDVPHVFERYDMRPASAKPNPYIFDPRHGQTKAFCSPRSLEKASNLIKQRAQLGDALLPALAGTVGAAAASDLEAFVRLGYALPSFESIIADPMTARLPASVAEYFMMAFKLAGAVMPDTLSPFIHYVKRWTAFEAQALFTSWVAGGRRTVVFAVKNRDFTLLANEHRKFVSL